MIGLTRVVYIIKLVCQVSLYKIRTWRDSKLLVIISLTGPISHLQLKGQEEHRAKGERTLWADRARKTRHHDFRRNGLRWGEGVNSNLEILFPWLHIDCRVNQRTAKISHSFCTHCRSGHNVKPSWRRASMRRSWPPSRAPRRRASSAAVAARGTVLTTSSRRDRPTSRWPPSSSASSVATGLALSCYNYSLPLLNGLDVHQWFPTFYCSRTLKLEN